MSAPRPAVTDLPPIPEAAVAVFVAYLELQVGHAAPVYIGALERAWPVAYAAALRARDAYPCCRHCAEDREHDVPPEGHAVPCDDCEAAL